MRLSFIVARHYTAVSHSNLSYFPVPSALPRETPMARPAPDLPTIRADPPGLLLRSPIIPRPISTQLAGDITRPCRVHLDKDRILSVDGQATSIKRISDGSSLAENILAILKKASAFSVPSCNTPAKALNL